MSETMQGVIEELEDRGVGKGSGIRVGGHKYGMYDPAALEKVAVGDTVSFRFVEKPNKEFPQSPHKNIQGLVTKLTGVAQSTAPPVASPDERQRMIVRQNALTNAVNFCTADGDMEIDLVISTARQFEAYTSGDLEREAASRLAEAVEEPLD